MPETKVAFCSIHYSPFSAAAQTTTLTACESVHLLSSARSPTIISLCRSKTTQTARPLLQRNTFCFFLYKSYKYLPNAGKVTPPAFFRGALYLPRTGAFRLIWRKTHLKKTKDGALTVLNDNWRLGKKPQHTAQQKPLQPRTLRTVTGDEITNYYPADYHLKILSLDVAEIKKQKRVSFLGCFHLQNILLLLLHFIKAATMAPNVLWRHVESLAKHMPFFTLHNIKVNLPVLSRRLWVKLDLFSFFISTHAAAVRNVA